jgi:serine/threonine protein kinase/formylglycine-generating enzyme required for sulfatase activity
VTDVSPNESPNDSTEQYDGTPASGRLYGREISTPKFIGRYRVSELIGTGGFGSVFRAADEALGRDVAIKIPRRKRSDADYSRWMAEARMVAMLEHPHIVPVYDAGSSAEFPFYVVSRFVAGVDLKAYLEQQQPAVEQSVAWAIAIAEALQHAHDAGLVHRDVKPSNILIDQSNRCWLTDFGLALHEDDVGRRMGSNQLIGTIAYMSPEQARGEGHLVDGRADIFALGIILYEMLSGARPFEGSSGQELLHKIVRSEPRLLRSWDSSLPLELERICGKALAQRRSDRYSSATEFAEDLKRYRGQSGGVELRSSAAESSPAMPTVDAVTDVAVIPKGLRAFDEHDRDFFLKLVPGPRDREGIPEILRRLKTSIESPSEQDTFRVGLVYGSSGSGKSSLLKAGLIPLLDDTIQVAYVEATAQQTESQLVRALSQFVPGQRDNDGLIRTISAIRRGVLGSGRKVLIVLDQFEQWLHAHPVLANTELVNALRQCDGTNIQCLALIRDDFWMPATQFFHELEVRLVQGVNSTAVDRFELRHARYVLSEFGRAYGCLPADPSQFTPEQVQFLDAVVDSVQTDGKVVSVQLVVLAQMLKGREWNLKTLAEFGGTAGVDINFLDETFTAAAAAPHHRALQAPARAVLAELLPEMGTDIKGQMQEVQRLREVSGLRSQDFAPLLEALDGELRLITPTVALEPEGDRSSRCYQLTHDFLVPPLREWLTRSQQQTARGRTRLRLRELSQYWRTKHEARFLPNSLEFLRIIALTNASDRTADEAKLVAAATRHHGTRWAMAAALLLLLGTAAYLFVRQVRDQAANNEATLAVNQLLDADVENVPGILRDLESLRQQAEPKLQSAVDDPQQTSTKKLFARLFLVDSDDGQVDPLVDATMTASVDEIMLICDRLGTDRTATERLWQIVDSDTIDEAKWIRAALALAQLDPQNSKWSLQSVRLVRALANQSTPLVVEMAPRFGELSRNLIAPAQALFGEESGDDVRMNAALILSNCVTPAHPVLKDLLVTATPQQFEVLFPVVADDPATMIPLLREELAVVPQATWPELDLPAAELPPAAGEVIASAGGFLTDTLAICQRLPLDQFESLAADMQAADYRPESVRPYRVGNQLLVAAVWHRDGKLWKFTQHDGPETARELAPIMFGEGLYPTDIAVIPPLRGVDHDEIQYAVLWTEGGEHVIDTKMYLGVTEEDHQSAGWEPLLHAGYVPKSNLKLKHPDGTDRYCSVRSKLVISPSYADCWNDSKYDYDARILSGWHQTDLRLNAAGQFDHEVTYGAVWWNGGTMESRTIDHADLESHLQKARSAARDGFRPVSISIVDDDDGPIAGSVWHRPVITDEAQDRIASRQANAVIALLRLGESETLWPLLAARPDQRLRSFIISRLSAFGISPKVLVQRLVIEPDNDRRFALIAALARYRPEQLTADTSATIRALIGRLGKQHPSAAIHSICEYLTRRWGWHELYDEITSAARPGEIPIDEPRWFTLAQGHTFVSIPGPVELIVGSPGHEAFRDNTLEVPIRVRIPRSFAISTAEVTVEQFQEFNKFASYAGEYTAADNSPINSVSWFEAARYCRWLSEQEKIDEDQMCYPPMEQIVPGFEFYDDMLDRTGYRLPTEAEWECACRAQTTTSRYYGSSPDLLPEYAWTMENASVDSRLQMQPVKQLMPNPFGLFDTLGNVMEWCHDVRSSDNASEGGYTDALWERSVADEMRMLRGSSVFYIPTSVRAAMREKGRSGFHRPYSGFRIARTMPNSGNQD